MKRLIWLIFSLSLILSGCASLFITPQPGISEQEVIALKGPDRMPSIKSAIQDFWNGPSAPGLNTHTWQKSDLTAN